MADNQAGTASASVEIRKVVLIVAGLTVLLSLMLSAFSLPAVHSGTKGVPIGVVGAGPQVAALTEQLESQQFEVTRYDDAAAAKDAILDREIYGSLEVAPGSVDVQVATAASAAASQAIQGIGTKLAEVQSTQSGHYVAPTVTELRGFPADDPKGAGLAAGALPLALGGWIAAVLIMQLIGNSRDRILAVFAFSVVGGLALVAVIQYVIGTFDGNYWLTSLAAMLGLAATAMGVLGLREFFGNAGLGIAAVALILLGNPLSGLTSAPEMLPTPWGYLGQLLPPGATGALLRACAYFSGTGGVHALIVLLCWLAGGLALYFAGLSRAAKKPGPEPDAQTTIDEVAPTPA
ncbi:MAG: hypothetical protein QM662_12660 [Gordonia sp. (in: high G+C Gram-positive bacteria)]